MEIICNTYKFCRHLFICLKKYIWKQSWAPCFLDLSHPQLQECSTLETGWNQCGVTGLGTSLCFVLTLHPSMCGHTGLQEFYKHLSFVLLRCAFVPLRRENTLNNVFAKDQSQIWMGALQNVLHIRAPAGLGSDTGDNAFKTHNLGNFCGWWLGVGFVAARMRWYIMGLLMDECS